MTWQDEEAKAWFEERDQLRAEKIVLLRELLAKAGLEEENAQLQETLKETQRLYDSLDRDYRRARGEPI